MKSATHFTTATSLHKAGGILVFLLALTLFVLKGIIIPIQENRFLLDFPRFYAAGKSWIEGDGMYNGALYREKLSEISDRLPGYDGMAYAPPFTPYAILIALPDFQTAQILYFGSNIVAIGLLVFILICYLDNPEEHRIVQKPSSSYWYLTAIVLGNAFTIRTLWLGQTTLWSTVLILGGWYLARRNDEAIGGILLGLASFKPQWLVLPCLWLILEGKWRVLLAVVGTTLGLAAYPLVTLGPVDTVMSWWAELAAYKSQTIGPDVVGVYHIVGLPSLLKAAGLPIPGTFTLLVGVVIFVISLSTIRRYLPQDYILGILFLLHINFIYAHSYEVIYLCSLLPVLWIASQSSNKRLITLLLLFVILCLPETVIYMFNISLLMHWKSLILFILALKVFHMIIGLLKPVGTDISQ